MVNLPIGRIDAPAPAAPTSGPGATAGQSPEFRRILERLEQLAAAAPAPAAPADAEQLQGDLQQADAGFADAMELRRRLEAAFRARLS